MILPWILGFLALAALLLRLERSLVFRPTRFVLQTPAHMDLRYEEVTLATADGVRLGAWWIPRADAVGTVLYFHGNKGTLGDRAWIARDLARLPVNVMMVDYRGFGNSSGRPSARGTRRDALAARHDLRGRLFRDLQGALATFLTKLHHSRVLQDTGNYFFFTSTSH